MAEPKNSSNANNGVLDHKSEELQKALVSSTTDPKQREAMLKKIKEMMDTYDTDKDGVLEAHEILKMHDELFEHKSESKFWITSIAILLFALVISVGCNLGTAYFANSLYQETKVNKDSIMTSVIDRNAVVSTSTATVNIPLALLPLAGVSVIDQIQHLQFSALNVNMTSGPQAGRIYDILQVGMDVLSYQLFNETSMLMIGPGSGKLRIDFGQVTASGLDGVKAGVAVDVCPGLGDPSHAKCSMLYLNDVDVNALAARARTLGMLPASGSRRLQVVCSPTASSTRAPVRRPSAKPVVSSS